MTQVNPAVNPDINSYDVSQALIAESATTDRQLETAINLTGLAIADSGTAVQTVAEHEAADAATVFRFARESGTYLVRAQVGGSTFTGIIFWEGSGNTPIVVTGPATFAAVADEDTTDTADFKITFFGAGTELGFVNTLGGTITELSIRRLSS